MKYHANYIAYEDLQMPEGAGHITYLDLWHVVGDRKTVEWSWAKVVRLDYGRSSRSIQVEEES